MSGTIRTPLDGCLMVDGCEQVTSTFGKVVVSILPPILPSLFESVPSELSLEALKVVCVEVLGKNLASKFLRLPHDEADPVVTPADDLVRRGVVDDVVRLVYENGVGGVGGGRSSCLLVVFLLLFVVLLSLFLCNFQLLFCVLVVVQPRRTPLCQAILLLSPFTRSKYLASALLLGMGRGIWCSVGGGRLWRTFNYKAVQAFWYNGNFFSTRKRKAGVVRLPLARDFH